MGGYLLGYDVGSSAIKASLLEAQTGRQVAAASSPQRELEIVAPKPGWAEQDPDVWWQHVKAATAMIGNQDTVDLHDVDAIGISYQMHGLVAVDAAGSVVRPAIIWCDSRAVEVGQRAFSELGESLCLRRLLNSPGNFTASKLSWVKHHEPQVFAKIKYMMLPGDYIGYRLTGSVVTTPSGLSEGIMWDFEQQALAIFLLDYFGIPRDVIPEVRPTFSIHGEVAAHAARELGIRAGTKVCYRAGDQPNNALSLSVLDPGEVAATAGTSGVVYGVGEAAAYDKRSRVNCFVHVNHETRRPRYGTLLCVNGTGILYSWLRHNCVGADLDYEQMNVLAGEAPVGADGLFMLPFGNGAERTLENRNIGASLHGLDFNSHTLAHVLRAAQEGIVFALRYGLEIMSSMGIKIHTVRAGNANMFLSTLFAEAFATTVRARLELYNTDGSQGAARGAGIGAGIYDHREAFLGLRALEVVEPQRTLEGAYDEAYARWKHVVDSTVH